LRTEKSPDQLFAADHNREIVDAKWSAIDHDGEIVDAKCSVTDHDREIA